MAISGANTPAAHLLAVTLDAVVVERARPSAPAQQNLSLDKAYDTPAVEEILAERGYTPPSAASARKSATHRGRKRIPRVVG